VNAIIGPPFASTGAPLLDTVDGKVPVISMASTDVSLADPSRGAFLASFSDPVQSSAMAQFALEQGYTTAITFSSADDVYFSGNPEYFTDAFEHGGGSVARDFSFSLADADFSTQVNEIATLDPVPEVLFTAMVMPQIQTLLEQLDAADLGDIVVMGVDGFDATVVWSLAADAVQILAAAATQACSVDGATLISTIDGLTDLPVTTGSVTYAGRNGVPDKDVVILTVEGGEPAFIEAMRPDYIAGA
jgi:branched-chain amino acid transport system substrate-binding protein